LKSFYIIQIFLGTVWYIEMKVWCIADMYMNSSNLYTFQTKMFSR
jgi:hypothetical protein